MSVVTDATPTERPKSRKKTATAITQPPEPIETEPGLSAEPTSPPAVDMDSEAAPAAESASETAGADTAPVTPSDAAGWRIFFTTVSHRDLWKAIQKEKSSLARVFAGFRATPEMLRNPIVLQRLVDEALKQPKFVFAVQGLTATPASDSLTAGASPGKAEFVLRSTTGAESSLPRPPSPKKFGTAKSEPAGAASTEESDTRLKDKLKEQRGALRERELRVAELEAALAAMQRERDTAKAAAESALAARKVAEAETDRLKRQREREARRDTAVKAAPPVEAKPKATTTIAAPVPVAAPQVWAEALRRLITRGKFSVVEDICREALTGGAEIASTFGRAQVHGLYAAALYGQGSLAAAEEQDRIAASAFLDSGHAMDAAECLARLLTYVSTVRSADAPLVRRLFLLGEKLGQADAVRDVFTRMRIASPEAHKRLRTLVSAGGGGGPKVASALVENLAPQIAAGSAIGPDEPVALPTLPAVTARRILAAVDSGDEDWVHQVQMGMDMLRERGGVAAATADALLEAVSALEPAAVQPFIRSSMRPIVVDASNVARHNPDPLAMARTPRVAYLRQMREMLLRRGYFPVYMIADANLRFHVDDRTAYEALIRRHIIRETPPGTAADETLIREARMLGVPLVTNDHLKEWGDAAYDLERFGFAILPGAVTLTDF